MVSQSYFIILTVRTHNIRNHDRLVWGSLRLAQLGNDTIILTGEQNNNSLCSVLTSHRAGYHRDFQVLHIIAHKRHEWWPLLGVQPCCIVGQMVTGEACATYRIDGCARCTFTDKEGINDNRETNWPEESMQLAGAKEKAIVIYNERYHQGIPAISHY